MKAKLSRIAPHKRMWKFEDGKNKLMLGEIFLGSYSAVFGNTQQVFEGVAFRSYLRRSLIPTEAPDEL